MGIVYRARDPIINRLVALKTITKGVAEDPNMLQRFYREAQSAGGLQHPNIVTIYDMGEEAGTPYIAMELVEGESLEQLIGSRPDSASFLEVDVRHPGLSRFRLRPQARNYSPRHQAR